MATSEHEIEAVAELGVALLLFSLGLEFSVARLRKLGPKPLLGGAARVVLTLLIAAAAWFFSPTVAAAVAFGAMVAPSSTAVVLRILMERGQIEAPHGRDSLGVLLTQNIAVVPLALLMTVLGGGGTAGEVAAEIGRLLLVAGGLVVALFLLTRAAVWALGTLTLRRNRELAVAFAAAAIGTSAQVPISVPGITAAPASGVSRPCPAGTIPTVAELLWIDAVTGAPARTPGSGSSSRDSDRSNGGSSCSGVVAASIVNSPNRIRSGPDTAAPQCRVALPGANVRSRNPPSSRNEA